MNEAGNNDALVFQFFNEIGIIEQLTRNQFERVMPDGMRIAHFTVLNHFVRLGREQSPASLASAFQVTKGAITNTLQRLDSKGFIEIRPDPKDGRGKLVDITEAGRAAHENAINALAPLIQNIHNEFGKDSFAKSLPLLQNIRIYLDKNR